MDRYKFQSFTTCWLCIKQVMIYYTLLSIVDISYYYRTAFKHTLPFYRVYFLPLLIYRVYNLLTAYPQTAFLQRSLFSVQEVCTMVIKDVPKMKS